MEQYQKHHQEHTHVLEDGTVVTHSHGHTHSHAHTKAVLNRLVDAIEHGDTEALEELNKAIDRFMK